MLQFQLRTYIFNNYKKLIISMILIVLLSFYSLMNVPYLYLPEGARINFGDYLIGELNMIQLIMFIAYPSIFSFLVLNIIRGDFEDNYIQLIFPRTTSRFIYLLNKFIIIIFVALWFTMTVVLSKLVISFVLKIPFENKCYNYIFHTMKYHNVYEVYFCNILLFFTGLVFIGMIALFLSLYIKNIGFSIGIIIFGGFVHNAMFIFGGKIIYLLPFTQYILILHKECGSVLDKFSLQFSYAYMLISIVIIFFMVLRILNKKEIGEFSI